MCESMTSLAANAMKRWQSSDALALLYPANGHEVKVRWRLDYWTLVKPILLRCFDDGAFMKALDDVALRAVHRLIAKQRAMYSGI